MNLTKEEAIRRHRMMWEWIANETIKRHECVSKLDAFRHFGWNAYEAALSCWCCEYTKITCTECPISWPDVKGKYSSCTTIEIDKNNWTYGLFVRWSNAVHSNDWRTAAYYALYISMLPERK